MIKVKDGSVQIEGNIIDVLSDYMCTVRAVSCVMADAHIPEDKIINLLIEIVKGEVKEHDQYDAAVWLVLPKKEGDADV